jgi:phosphomannomutase
VVEARADIGFAQDADADRMAIVSEKGEILGEESSLALVTKFILKSKKGPVVTNLSTTRAIDDIAKEYGCAVTRTPVGEVNVAEKMKEMNAAIGGEGNGGIIDPRVHYGRDSLIGIATILEYLAESGKKISELNAEIPKYYIEKKKIDASRNEAVKISKYLAVKYKDAKLNFDDGLRIDWDDSWVHIRRSGTEPIMRIIAESKSKKKTIDIINNILIEIEENKKD